jgi:hypothetical protein
MTADAAVRAAERGWHIFPCLPGTKEPAISRWPERASADPEHIAEAWETRYAGHNIGIACGPSGLVVIDLDTHGELPLGWRDEPGIVDGKDVLAALAERAGQGWPSTYLVRTPSSGWHLYYLAPEGEEIRNSAKKIGPMIDVRGCGGYVVAAGSVVDERAYPKDPERAEQVRGGKPYETLSGPEEHPEPLPPWLQRLIKPPLASPLYGDSRPAAGPVPSRLRGLIRTLTDATEGERNTLLFWTACRAASVVADGEASAEQVREVLMSAALHIGLGEREARSSISSGLRNGAM